MQQNQNTKPLKLKTAKTYTKMKQSGTLKKCV